MRGLNFYIYISKTLWRTFSKMNIIEKNLKDIKPYEKNPRKNDNAVEYVANSIKEFGFKVPIVIDKDGVIVAGHTRYKASKKLGLDKVPCIVADDLTDEQIKAYRLADNKVGESAKWDEGLLGAELSEILNINMELFDFDLTIDEEEDEEPEVEFTRELGEENNYIVLMFDNTVDWLQAQTLFDLKPVKALDSKKGFERIGLGRVIDGTMFINKMMEDNDEN